MNRIKLTAQNEAGIPLEAIFEPEKGMNLSSFKKGGIEVIHEGQGLLIGPSFGKRPAYLAQENDPFVHGMARYASWKAESNENSLSAVLSGQDLYQDLPLSAWEGQNFKMRFAAHLGPKGLKLELSIVSETDSLTGIEYHYMLPHGKSRVISQVQNSYRQNGVLRPLPKEWGVDAQQRLTLDTGQAADYTFYPYPNPLHGEVLLETPEYRLVSRFFCESQENSWRLWHPTGAPFICIQPFSAQDPLHPNLTVNAIGIELEIL